MNQVARNAVGDYAVRNARRHHPVEGWRVGVERGDQIPSSRAREVPKNQILRLLLRCGNQSPGKQEAGCNGYSKCASLTFHASQFR